MRPGVVNDEQVTGFGIGNLAIDGKFIVVLAQGTCDVVVTTVVVVVVVVGNNVVVVVVVVVVVNWIVVVVVSGLIVVVVIITGFSLVSALWR